MRSPGALKHLTGLFEMGARHDRMVYLSLMWPSSQAHSYTAVSNTNSESSVLNRFRNKQAFLPQNPLQDVQFTPCL